MPSAGVVFAMSPTVLRVDGSLEGHELLPGSIEVVSRALLTASTTRPWVGSLAREGPHREHGIH